MKYHLKLITLVVLEILLAGCLASSPPPSFHQLSTLPPKSICHVAVLPFVNDTLYNLGDIIVYRVFTAELNRSGRFVVSLEGDVRKIYRQLQLTVKEQPTLEQSKIIAARLGVDAVVTGRIVTMSEEDSAGQNNPILALDIKIIEAGSGAVLLSTYNTRDGEHYRKVLHFGMINTITELSRLVSQEIIELWLAKGIGQCTE